MGPRCKPRQSGPWAYKFHHCTPLRNRPLENICRLIGDTTLLEPWWDQTYTLSIKYLSWSDSWQLIRFDIFKSISIDFFSPEERTRAWWIKPVLSVLWNDGESSHELAVPRMAGKAGAAACCLWEKPFLGSIPLWGVPTRRWVNNTGFILLSCDVFCNRGAAKQEQMVCAWAWPWSDEYLCDQHIKSHFNRYHFDGFNKLI